MRIAARLVTLVCCGASPLLASPVLSLEFLNSDFTFGTVSPDQTGHDLSSFFVDGVRPDFDFWGSSYQAQGGTLVQQTLNVNGSGDVVGSDYLYDGGTFEIFFDLEKNGATIQGSFVAPIETLTVSAGEHAGDPATASYVLGKGVFDPAIASALGIGLHTRGGESFSQLLLTDDGNRPGVAGDHTTPERQAWDGVNDITLDVPEPATFALVALGAGVWMRRRSGRPV
jgi:hypothetical protein